MSDSSRSQIRYIEEAIWGETPVTPAMRDLRFNSESLTQAIQTAISEEIRSDRQITDLVVVGGLPGGDISGELSFDNLDDFLEGALFGSWGTPVVVSETTISASNADNSLNDSGSGFITAGIVAGQWLKVAGFIAEPTNNGYVRVVTVTAAKLIVESKVALVDDTPGTAVTLDGTMLRNGITPISYSVEVEFADVTQFIAFTGMMVNSLNIKVESKQMVASTLGLVGAKAVRSGTTIADSNVEAPTNDVMNAAVNVAELREAGAPLSGTWAKTVDLSIANNLRNLDAIGTLDSIGIGSGRCQVTGSISVYFQDGTIYDKLLAGTASSLAYVLEDGAGNAYIVSCPKLKFTEGAPQVGGADQDIMLDLGFQAIMDPVTGCTIQIDKVE